MTYLSTLGVNLVDGLEGIQVVDTGINTDLVHDNNTGSLGTSEEIELTKWRKKLVRVTFGSMLSICVLLFVLS